MSTPSPVKPVEEKPAWQRFAEGIDKPGLIDPSSFKGHPPEVDIDEKAAQFSGLHIVDGLLQVP